MKLLIISHTAHYHVQDHYVGWGPTIREINYLAELFEEVIHVAPLHSGEIPQNVLPYTSSRIKVVAVPPAGGERLTDKLGILINVPLYTAVIWRLLPHSDIVHIRCPANISLIALILLFIAKYPKSRWIKYAGNWKPDQREAWSYSFQRWLLQRNVPRGRVTVNGHWADQREHIHTFLNPCLTDDELNSARQIATEKRLILPLQAIFVGRVEAAKGIGIALQVVSRLIDSGVPVQFHVVGDGAERKRFETQANDLGIEMSVKFYGWLPRTELAPLYSHAHVTLFPTRSSEGWPKVISEAMAYGVVPLAGAVSSIPQYLREFETGHALPPEEVDAFCNAIRWYIDHPDQWRRESENSVRFASRFTYASYLEAVRKLLGLA